ncbi:MAG: aspartate aminotransferase family protein [Bacteroidaceae bacterium]|nr:aspartate aminotransferase family protein [Bacteroidaceae bacterium]
MFPVYPLYPVEPVRGEGNYVFDAAGTRYLDFYGGHAVISIGHAHPRYVQAVSEQVARIGFYSNSVENSLQQRLADTLRSVSGYKDHKLFLVNSGAEANENAIKVASFHTGRERVLAFSGAFHGRTSGAVEVTDNPRINSPFNRTDKVTFVPLGNLDAVRRELATETYCAVIIEGIQGVAGIQVPDNAFLQALREVTLQTGTCLILDEVQSGYGRTGRFFAHQHAEIEADLVTMAKGMGCGFPIGGVLIAPHFEAWPGMLGTTFGGNHLACAAAQSVLDVIADEQLVSNAAKVGDELLRQLSQIEGISNVRGRGLMIGFDVEEPASQVRRRLVLKHHVFTGGAGTHTIRLLPALTVQQAHVDECLEALRRAIYETEN